MDNNRANQLNPNNWRYWKSRGYPGRPSNWEDFSNGVSWLTTVFRAAHYVLKGIFTVIRGVYYFLVGFFGAKGATVIIAGTSIAGAGYYAYTKDPDFLHKQLQTLGDKSTNLTKNAILKANEILTSFDVASRVDYLLSVPYKFADLASKTGQIISKKW